MISKVDFSSKASKLLWHRFPSERTLDWSTGTPILVIDEETREYIKPSITYLQDLYAKNTALIESLGGTRRVRHFLNTGRYDDQRSSASNDAQNTIDQPSPVRIQTKDAIHGVGVFANRDFLPGEIIGPYNGTIYLDEEMENECNHSSSENRNLTKMTSAEKSEKGHDNHSKKEDDNHLKKEDDNHLEKKHDSEEFVFYLNEGAHGVYLDGSHGAHVNELKYLNHSCQPTAKMVEIFIPMEDKASTKKKKKKKTIMGETSKAANNPLQKETDSFSKETVFNSNSVTSMGDKPCSSEVLCTSSLFPRGSWHVVIVALGKGLRAGEEITHDYELVTDDPTLRAVKCTCRSSNCRQTLYRFDCM